MLKKYTKEDISSKIHLRSHSKLEKFFKQKVVGLLIEQGFVILTIIWTFSFLLFDINILPYIVILIILITLAVFQIYLNYINFNSIKLTEVRIKSKKIEGRVSFAFVTDLHIGNERESTRGDRLSKIINILNGLGVDLVLFGGDFVTEKYETDLLNRLTEINIKKKYGVLGNHDSHYLENKQHDELPIEGIRILEEVGIKILINEGIRFENIYIGGIPDLYSKDLDLKKTFNGSTSNEFRILLSHNPEIINFLEADDEIDLILSGHTHSGQIFIPILGNILPMPVGDRKLNRGIKTPFPNTKLFISQGAGVSGTRIRFGTSAEICIVHLVSEIN